MVEVDTDIKQASLDGAYDASLVAPVVTLRQKLREYEETARALMSTGREIASVSASNGAGSRSQSYFPTSTNGLTTTQLVGLWRQLINLFDFAYRALGGTPTDLQVKTEMMALLVPVTRVAPSCFVSLRCA